MDDTTTRPNLGPLTTLFTPSPTCSLVMVRSGATNVGWMAQSCDIRSSSMMPVDATSCWPTIAPDVPSPKDPFRGWGFYSPATVCPYGYSTAEIVTSGDVSPNWTPQFTLVAGETAFACCPSSFTPAFDPPRTWDNTFLIGAQTCTSIGVASGFAAAICGTDGRLSTGMVSSNLPMTYTEYAPLIQMNIGGISQSSPTTTATPTPPASSPTGGAIAGAVVGAIVGLVVIAAAVLFLRRYRKRHNKSAGEATMSSHNHEEISKGLVEPPQTFELPTRHPPEHYLAEAPA
ncbi:hypothetical protein BP6252_13146 [Coleophoma cylindrospora]|uniref:Uncharacterized protein n=1 Tax=Coleophoma cylindrospora TaxID=1849047 RepID=A0A3D8QAH1_9HELO|nr:hypothetical protein BP6252_13146 [Coleophoma cylindrospora]